MSVRHVLRPEGKRPDTTCLEAYAIAAASRCTMPWCGVSLCTVPWQALSELSRLHPKRLVHLEHPNVQHAIYFFPDAEDELLHVSREHHPRHSLHLAETQSSK